VLHTLKNLFKKNRVESVSKVKTEDLTILIPSKDRPKQLSALLKYFANNHIPYKIIILESGHSYRSLLADYPTLDIELHEFDPDILFGKKMLSGAELIKTPLVCLCADDDLVFKNAMEESAEFLKLHPEYSACQGYHGRFEEKGQDFYLMDFWWYHPSIESNDPLERLQELICRYQPVCWSVLRTDVFLWMHHRFIDIKTPLFFELFWSSMATIAGKVKRLPSLYGLRKNDTIVVFGHPRYLFAESPENFCKDYLAYRTCLEKALKIDDKFKRRSLDLMHTCLFHQAADQGFLRYVTQQSLKHPESSILNPACYPSVTLPTTCFTEKNSLTIKRGNRTYHFAAKFLNPQPAEEICVPKNFHLKLMDDLDMFTRQQDACVLEEAFIE